MSAASLSSELPPLTRAEMAAVLGWEAGCALRLDEYDVYTLIGLCEEFAQAREGWIWQEGEAVAGALALAIARKEPAAWLRPAVVTLASKPGRMHIDRVERYLAVICRRRRGGAGSTRTS
jgi:hypothetical protein